MRATLTLMGLYNANANLFDGLTVPDGVDKDNTVNTILMTCDGLEVVYPNPDIMQFAVTEWAKHRLPSWVKLWATTTVEYNPIENYDRKEDWTDSGEGNATGARTSFDSEELKTTDGSQSASRSTHSGRVHGNVGVTTTQQMLQSEREVAMYDIVQEIANEFKQRFCLLIY